MYLKSILPFCFLSLFLISLSRAQSATGDYFVYVSSSVEDNNAGIVLLDFNSTTGELTKLKEFPDFKTTSYLNISPDYQYLYTVGGDEAGTFLAGFAIDPTSGGLSMINRVGEFGRGPCYVAVSNSNRHVLVANYSEGNICAFKKEDNGTIAGQTASVYHQGASKVTDRQEAPHPHMILPDPAGNNIVVPDLGMDKVLVYRLKKNGKLVPAKQAFGTTPPGAGPRHFAFHPSKPYAYVLNELEGSVTSYQYDSKTGALTTITTQSSLPKDFKEYNKSADIHLTPDGRFLYASNRGHNSIAVYAIQNETGVAEFKGTFRCGGEWPRAFEVDPSGKFLLVANKNSHDISVFRINQETGYGDKIGSVPGLAGPQCIKFVKR